MSFLGPLREKKTKHKETLNYLSIVIAAEIALVTAVVLFFFVYSTEMSIVASTSGALVALLFGSVLCFTSIVAAEAIFIASILGAELVILNFFPGMMIPFIVADLAIIVWLASHWNVSDEEPPKSA